MAIVLGINAKMFYQTDGVGGSAGWNELSNVKDVSLNLEKGEADVTTRGGNGWRQRAATLKDGSVTFQMVWDTSDSGFTALKDAYFNDSLIGIRVLDGALGGSAQGLKADMEVMNFTRNENLEEALMVDVTLAPGRGSTAPVWETNAS